MNTCTCLLQTEIDPNEVWYGQLGTIIPTYSHQIPLNTSCYT